ncbi:MAG: hypothetical protein WB439_04780 [Acidobacteriaceae bacterium]
MTLPNRIEKPFEEYMAWCVNYVQEKAQRDPITSILLSYPFALAALEASWARRYWIHHASRVNRPA